MEQYINKLEVDLSNLAFNVRQINKYLKKQFKKDGIQICGVVKCNAYGHGLIEICKKLNDLSIKFVMVSKHSDGLLVRKFLNNINILSLESLCNIPFPYLIELIKKKITLTITSIDAAMYLNECCLKNKIRSKVHIEIDTGLNRTGFRMKNAYNNISKILTLNMLDYEGIYTQLTTSENKNKSFAKLQLKRFKEILKLLKNDNFKFRYIHASNSGAVLNLKSSYFNLIRIGLLLYGYHPTERFINKITLKPVLSLKSKIISIVKKTKKRKFNCFLYIICIPLGFLDGLRLSFFKNSYVLVKGIYLGKIITIYGNNTLVKIKSKECINIGDEVQLFGFRENQIIRQINYSLKYKLVDEILTGFPINLKRIYI